MTLARRMRSLPLMKLACSALVLLALAAPAAATPIVVAGTSDPWLAGMAHGASASSVDRAPEQGPVLVTGFPLVAGERFTFSATGGVMNFAGCPTLCDGPDGNYLLAHYAGAENGLANVVAPLNSLLGVFLGNDSPNLAPSPAALSFEPGFHGLNFLSISPQLRQIFFIGDGRTSAQQVQEFVVPVGATRLFLGTMDGWEWSNNTGAFIVDIAMVHSPEPASVALLGTGLAVLHRRLRRYRVN